MNLILLKICKYMFRHLFKTIRIKYTKMFIVVATG